jgi:Flp pilus assembly pilin Flp
MFTSLLEILDDDAGASLVEYALIIALVSVIAVAALKLLGASTSASLNNSVNAITG